MKSISVVIPNYNGKHLFEKYFEHNYKLLTSLNTDVQIIVVDDASRDGSVAYLREHYQDRITVIEKATNSGFSETCNIGIQQASNDLVFLLNTDVTLEPGYFEKLYKYFEYKDTFGVMGRIIGMDDDNILDAARSPKILGRKIKPSHFFYLNDSQVLTPTFYLSGAIALMDTKKLKTIHGFNEMFNPYYGEDQELSIRAWRLGWKCYYEHDAVCRHEVSASTKGHKDKYNVKRIYFRNRYYIHHLHLHGFDLNLYHLQVILCDVLPSLFTLQFYKAEAYLDFLRNRKGLQKKKNAFSRQMRRHRSEIGIRDIVQNISLMLKYEHVVKL
ncbi:Undecaprenyl-phosphate 4-deoxy-4-formamido-L-arabinose transferase [Dyadobacter sp. CECT 9275]|uniref:Undecaprenyl-phosphate 4-deoxy-4-formamido-L-arabinose transferase n=1 Tax=Dyadobacter helix TaxID=2822344 RepID=A0A916N7H0_9BACT|nr:glycosyltransferase family 2 protein [Dyadobacter sp. CECT 9275]CAG5016748.1 Undecaprenyl-phosphate 4-deoxy-4-formamido-L-arabinose transferase [Dyadobacter sp. CECT 9275]